MIGQSTFDPNESFDGRILLAVAAELKNVDFAAALLERGADVNVWDREQDMTPLGVAASKGNMEVIELLLKHGADPNLDPPICGTPALIAAAMDPHRVPVLQRLLDAGANPNLAKRSQYGNVSATALTNAASRDNVAGVALLLSRGADINVVVAFGTALGQAVEEGNYDIAKFLLERGADPMLVAPLSDGIPMSGKTSLQIAMQKKNKRMIKLLSEYDKSIPLAPDAPSSEKIGYVMLNIRKAIRDSSVILSPGLTKDAFQSLQAEAGTTLPDALRDFYLKNDGETDDSEGLIPRVGGDPLDDNFRILPLASAFNERSHLPQISHDFGVDAVLWPVAADGSGDVMYAVIKEGRVASVIQFSHESQKADPIANSLTDWLTQGLEMWIEMQD